MKGEWNWMLDPPKTNIKSIGKEFPPKEVIKHLKSLSTELQLKADEYYEKALASTYGVKRYEHLEDGLIMFTYSDFSITKIRQLYSEKYGTYFVSQLYQTTRCKNDPETRGRTVADELNEKWAEVIPITQSSNESVLNRLKEMAKSTYPTTVSI